MQLQSAFLSLNISTFGLFTHQWTLRLQEDVSVLSAIHKRQVYNE